MKFDASARWKEKGSRYSRDKSGSHEPKRGEEEREQPSL